jgi:TolB protein
VAAIGFALVFWAFRTTHESVSSPGDGLGGEIAFSSGKDGIPTLWTVNPGSSTGPHQLLGAVNARPQFDPQWSPDGKMIAFRAQRQESGAGSIYGLFVADIATGTVVNISPETNGDASQGSATWSPGGDKIAYVEDSNSGSSIVVWTAAGSSRKQLTSHATDVNPSWSSDGSAIAFARLEERSGVLTADIWTVSVNGQSLSRLTSASGYDAEPAWSPTGSSIAFVSDRTGSSEVYVMQSDGSNPSRLTDISAEDIEALAWSPDGRAIAFQAYSSGNWDIYVVDVATSQPIDLTADARSDEVYPVWSPDGLQIGYLAGPPVAKDVANASKRDIFIVRPDGSDLQRLTVDAQAVDGLTWQRLGGSPSS